MSSNYWKRLTIGTLALAALAGACGGEEPTPTRSVAMAPVKGESITGLLLSGQEEYCLKWLTCQGKWRKTH